MADDLITKKITEVQNFSNGDLGTIIQVQGDEIGQTNVSTLKQDITNSVVTELTESGGVSLNLINPIDVVPTYADLDLITPTPQINDAYQVEADGLVYVYTENGFQSEGDGFKVQPNVNGVVEEGNENAVSGGEVYDSIEPLATKTELIETELNGVSDLDVEFTNDLYIDLTGNEVVSGNYKTSDFIAVSDIYRILANLSGGNTLYVISAYTSNNQASFISNSVMNTIGKTANTTPFYIDLFVQSGVNYLRFTRHNSANQNLIYVNKYQNSIKSSLNGNDIPVFWSNSFIDLTGNEVASGNYRTSGFIPVYKGDLIDLTASGSASILTVSAYSSDNQSSFISASEINKSGNGTPTVFTSYNLTIPDGVNFIKVVRHRDSPMQNFKLKHVSLEDRITNLEQNGSANIGQDPVFNSVTANLGSFGVLDITNIPIWDESSITAITTGDLYLKVDGSNYYLKVKG